MDTALIILLLLLLIVLGAELYLLIGGVSLLLFYCFADLPMFAVVKTMFDTINKPALLAIPLYVFAGAIMARGVIAGYLIELAKSTFGWMKGGLAAAAVIACIFFAAISGSSPVTLIAIGTLMYPALRDSGYPDRLSIGTLTVSGSLGILIPPSIPLIVFAMITGANINKLFIAGIVPGVLTGILIMGMCLVYGYRYNLATVPFSLPKAWTNFRKGFLALLMPVLILGGIYAGYYTVTEAAAVAAIYAIVVELLYYRQLKLRDIVDTLYDSVLVLGIIFVIIAMATVFNFYLSLEQVPMMLVEYMEAMVDSRLMFLLLTILLLILVGLFMDIISAVLILAPLLLPTAMLYDVDIIHFGIVFILALEIGYMTPPIGINLFVASGLFNKPFNTVVAASFPFLLAMLAALLLVAAFPEITLWLTRMMD